MPSDWSINFWPPIACDIFLSYCREDRERLVLPVYDALKQMGMVPWIDKHQYPVGRDGFEALREELLRCRHIAYFITPSLLKQGRGWPTVERTYSELIQRRTTYQGTEFQQIELPLVFANPSHPILPRSVWFQTLGRARFYRLSREHKQTQIEWAVEQIQRFAKQHELRADDIRKRLRRDQQARQHFSSSQGLLRRIRATAPLPPIH